MPRTLPWLLNKPAAKNTTTSSSSPVPKRRKRESSPEDLVDADLNDVATPPPRPRQKRRADRDPSSSPAAPVSPEGVTVEYMRPGVDEDDVWHMVEDEFESTARFYSKQLHHAEYVRLQKLSKSRGEKTLSALGHGTDSNTEKSRQAQLKEERKGKDEAKQDALDTDEEAEEDDAGDAYWQDPQLAGLMSKDTDTRVGKALAGMTKAKSNTRAAAGFMESPHTVKRHRDALSDDGGHGRPQAKASSSRVPKMFVEVSDDEEDDLVAKPIVHSRTPRATQSTRTSGDDRARDRDRDEPRRDNVFRRFAEPSKELRSGANDAYEKSLSTQIKIEDNEDAYEAPRPRPPRPTYKKAQNRQASQALGTQDANGATRPSLSALSSENRMFKRSPISSSTSNGCSYAERVSATSPHKETSSSSTLGPQSPESLGRREVNAAAGYLAKRKADRARGEKEQQARMKQADDIPTFLF